MDVRSARDHPNVQAVLRVVRAGESSQDDEAYHTLFGGGRFEDLSRHPNQAVTRTLKNGRTVTSTAAGAYQHLYSTWLECRKGLDLPDFGPDSQDLATVFLIDRRRALDDVLRGDIVAAIGKLNREWASLPGSPYGQGEMTMEHALKIYELYSGAPSQDKPQEPSAEPTQSKAKTMPALSILAAALPLLSKYIPDLASLFPKGRVAERNVKLVEKAVDIVKDAVGAKNVEEAVDILESDPKAVVQAQQAVKDNWFELVEVGGGVEGAFKRNLQWATSLPNTPLMRNPAFVISIILLLMVFMMLADVFFVHPERYTGPLLTQVVTALLMIIGLVAGYWIGTSFSSARKSELAAGAPPITS